MQQMCAAQQQEMHSHEIRLASGVEFLFSQDYEQACSVGRLMVSNEFKMVTTRVQIFGGGHL